MEAGGPVGVGGDDTLGEVEDVVVAIPLGQSVKPFGGGVPLRNERGMDVAVERQRVQAHALLLGLQENGVAAFGRQRQVVVAARGRIADGAGEYVAAQTAVGLKIGERIHCEIRFRRGRGEGRLVAAELGEDDLHQGLTNGLERVLVDMRHVVVEGVPCGSE